MQPQLVAWVGARQLWVWAAVGVLGALSLVYLLPLVLVPEVGLDDPGQRLNAENDLRATLVQAIGGAVLLFGTWQTLRLNREGQFTERFTGAIDQLGATGREKLDVRLGGIYALERIARDSRTDRGPIIEVLTAFLREHTRWSPDNADTSAVTGRGEAGADKKQRSRLRADFQAVATVLERNRWSGEHLFDLREADLHHVNLVRAHLERANLSDVHLEEANLTSANLERANLSDAHLEWATLTGARLFWANLERANLSDAHLEWARLTGARLKGAKLTGARLEGADLTAALLEGADLTGAHMEGVRGLTPAQLKGVIGLSEATGVPPGLVGT